MSEQIFEKPLTANDTGESGGHQAGIHVPKSQTDLVAFLPPLDPGSKNPSVWLTCVDDSGEEWQFRYIYYNNKLHDPGGTRDEYRITHMTTFFRAVGARSGDVLVIAGRARSGNLRIRLKSADEPETSNPGTGRIKLRGWRRVH